jgi:hypothetical protein
MDTKPEAVTSHEAQKGKSPVAKIVAKFTSNVTGTAGTENKPKEQKKKNKGRKPSAQFGSANP